MSISLQREWAEYDSAVFGFSGDKISVIKEVHLNMTFNLLDYTCISSCDLSNLSHCFCAFYHHPNVSNILQ